MSVLIKGMEMPKSCCGCVFSAYTPTGKIPYCKRTGKDLVADVYFNKRDYDCPLVPVPPHGRLIEKGTILDKCYQHFEDYMNGIVDGKTALLNIEKEIKAAPAIIPAEEEGK